MDAMPEWAQITVVAVICAAIFGPLLVGLVLVIRDTVRGSGRWGVNTRPIRCPRCDEPAPLVRRPANFRQMLWGGHTCRECGCEYDKWGKPIHLPEASEAAPVRPPAAPRRGDDRVRRQPRDVRRPPDRPPAGDDHA